MKRLSNSTIGIVSLAVLIVAVTFLAACTSQNGSGASNTTHNDTMNSTGNATGKIYIKTDPAECKVIKFMCTVGTQPFTDSKGCGCEPIPSNETQNNTGNQSIPGVPSNETEGNLTKHYCSNESRNADVCYQLFKPVCGWFNQSVQCLTYPCAATYSNDCFACKDAKVAYYTEGKCPSPGVVH